MNVVLSKFLCWNRMADGAGRVLTIGFGIYVQIYIYKLKLRLKNTIIDETLTYPSPAWTLTERHWKQLNIFERKVYRRILGPVYDNEKENWRVLSNKEIYAVVKKPTIIETVRLNRLCWFGHVQRMEENRIPKRVLYTRWFKYDRDCNRLVYTQIVPVIFEPPCIWIWEQQDREVDQEIDDKMKWGRMED